MPDPTPPELLPTPRIIDDKDWPTFAKHETNAAYERYGIVPGAFVDDDNHVLYASESWAKAVFGNVIDQQQDMLGEHECGHDWKGYKHRTTIVGGFLDALRDGFDTRAFTRLLRFRWNKAIHARYVDWRNRWSSEWKRGKLVSQPAPKT